MGFHDRPVCLAQSDDGNFALAKILLMNQVLICGDQQLKSSPLSRLQQDSVFESRPAQFIWVATV